MYDWNSAASGKPIGIHIGIVIEIVLDAWNTQYHTNLNTHNGLKTMIRDDFFCTALGVVKLKAVDSPKFTVIPLGTDLEAWNGQNLKIST